MENATLQDLEGEGYVKIGEMDNDGQGQLILMARKFVTSGSKGIPDWQYMIVDLTDDGYVQSLTGLANGKVFK